MTTLPGFTAEISLYEAAGGYRRGTAHVPATDGLAPAQYLARGIACYRNCVAQCSPADPYCEDNCHCICYGRPCPGHGCNCWLM